MFRPHSPRVLSIPTHTCINQIFIIIIINYYYYWLWLLYSYYYLIIIITFFSCNLQITPSTQPFSLPALYSFYFRKRYTETCNCSLCAVEKPGVLSRKNSYLSISGENHEIENHQEMAGLSLEKPQDWYVNKKCWIN